MIFLGFKDVHTPNYGTQLFILKHCSKNDTLPKAFSHGFDNHSNKISYLKGINFQHWKSKSYLYVINKQIKEIDFLNINPTTPCWVLQPKSKKEPSLLTFNDKLDSYLTGKPNNKNPNYLLFFFLWIFITKVAENPLCLVIVNSQH